MIKRIHSNLFYSRDLDATRHFYENAGFQVEGDEKTIRIIFGDFRLAFVEDGKADIQIELDAPRGVGMFTYVEVDDVDKHYSQLVSKGIKPSSEPKDWPWGKREFVARDPDGYKLVFYSPVK